MKFNHIIPGFLCENGEAPASLFGDSGFEISFWNFMVAVNGISFLIFPFRSPNETFMRELPFIK